MGHRLWLILKTLVILIIGLFLMGLRPSISLSLQKSPVSPFIGLYQREFVALAVSLLLLMIAIIISSRGHIKAYGFIWPSKFNFIKPILFAFLAGAASTALSLLFRFRGPKFMGEMTFVQVVVMIWIIASIYEELVVRGFIQGSLGFLRHRDIKVIGPPLSLPVIISGLFFGLSHLALLSTGAGIAPVILIVLFAIVIGLLAAQSREKTGSLVPAILIHIMANIGGTVGGYLN